MPLSKGIDLYSFCEQASAILVLAWAPRPSRTSLLRLKTDGEFFGGSLKGAVPGPKEGRRKARRSQEMNIDEAKAGAHEPMGIDEMHDFPMAGHRRLGKGLQQLKDFPSFGKVSAGQLADHEGMANDFLPLQKGAQRGAASPKMINPYGRVNKDHGLSFHASSSGNGAEPLLRSAEPGEPPGALPGDQRFQAHPDQGRLFFDTGQLGRLAEDSVINIYRRSHMHIYAIFMHIRQDLLSIIRDEPEGANFSARLGGLCSSNIEQPLFLPFYTSISALLAEQPLD